MFVAAYEYDTVAPECPAGLIGAVYVADVVVVDVDVVATINTCTAVVASWPFLAFLLTPLLSGDARSQIERSKRRFSAMKFADLSGEPRPQTQDRRTLRIRTTYLVQ